MAKTSNNNDSVPYQVLVLLAPHLDPKTLAIASCVSKSWFISMSSDHLWEPLTSTHFASLHPLHAISTIPYRHLYALGITSAKRRQRKPPKPHLALENLIFHITVHYNKAHVFTVLKSGRDLENDPNGLFRYDINVENAEFLTGDEAEEGLKANWNVILEGYKGVFTLMDCKGKGRFVMGSDGWFSEELPAAGCCSGLVACGLVADMRLGLRGEGRSRVVEKVGVGVLNILSWRYASVEDAFRYLQHFLLPC